MPEVYRTIAVCTGDGRSGHSCIPPERGERLLAQAHQRCPYSKATRNNIDVHLVLGDLRETATR